MHQCENCTIPLVENRRERDSNQSYIVFKCPQCGRELRLADDPGAGIQQRHAAFLAQIAARRQRARTQ